MTKVIGDAGAAGVDGAYAPGMRARRFERLSASLAALSDAELGALPRFDASRPLLRGGHGVFELDGEPIFVKRVPLLAADLAAPGSTANLHGLPMFYHYDVGSLGFGAWRERAILDKTNAWVLSGEAQCFPLMLHQRQLPLSAAPPRAFTSAADLDAYAREWGDDAAVRAYVEGRDRSDYMLVLCFEHVPFTLRAWLNQHQQRAGDMLRKLLAAIDFLRAHGIAHLDAHFENVLTDGETIFLADFGLALDRAFDLATDERAFFDQHTRYDYGLALACVPFMLAGQYWSLAAAEQARVRSICELDEPVDNIYALSHAVAWHLEALRDDGALNIDRVLIDAFKPYRATALHMLRFYTHLSRDHSKRSRLDHAVLRRLLARAGVGAARSVRSR